MNKNHDKQWILVDTVLGFILKFKAHRSLMKTFLRSIKILHIFETKNNHLFDQLWS